MCPAGSLRPTVLRFGCWTHDTSPHSTNSRWSLVRALVALGLWASLQRSSKPPAPYRSLGRAVAAIAALVFLFGRYAPSRYTTQSRKIFAAWFCQRPVMSALVALSGAVCPAGSLRRWLLCFGCWTHDTLSHHPRSFLSLGSADITLGAQN